MRLCLVGVALLALVSSVQAMDLNSYRAKHGRAPLRVDSSLTGLAYFHALDLARRGRLDHAGFLRGRAPLGA
ncbi:MAG TPA: CAP domain-containing protein, partial [Xanthobacteraceae bacterium]|nr:CAP domain-containing protein [Xanthobacteraceae bacterium]